MPAKIELQRTGFFREMPHGDAADPSLADARRPTPSPHEDRIAAYLDAGHVYLASPGTTQDVFDPETQIGPPHQLTDGRFLWPGDLAHYVRTYHVRLDGSLLAHMLANGWAVSAGVELTALAPPGHPEATTDAKTDTPPRVDLAAVLADFVGAVSGGGDSIKKSIEDAGNEAVRAIGALGDDLRRKLEVAGGKASAQLSASLHNLRGWLDKPDEERTAQVQAFVASLEARLEAARDPQRRTEAEERGKQLTKQIRDSIADLLRKHAPDPGDHE
jgi:hypothetical protein